MADRKQTIRDFLKRFFRDAEVADSDDIFALGFVNSLIALQLVQFVEGQFEIEIDDDDLDLANFRSIDAIDALVERKLTGA